MVLKDTEAREVCALIHVCTHIQTCGQGSPFWVAFEKRMNDEKPQPLEDENLLSRNGKAPG